MNGPFINPIFFRFLESPTLVFFCNRTSCMLQMRIRVFQGRFSWSSRSVLNWIRAILSRAVIGTLSMGVSHGQKCCALLFFHCNFHFFFLCTFINNWICTICNVSFDKSADKSSRSHFIIAFFHRWHTPETSHKHRNDKHVSKSHLTVIFIIFFLRSR